jgi:acetyl esterase/lipase
MGTIRRMWRTLEDAQQAMRLTRAHAAEWGIDPKKVGVIGFSAGAHLAVALSTHPDFQGKNVRSSTVDARPDFQMVIYPGWLTNPAGGERWIRRWRLRWRCRLRF